MRYREFKSDPMMRELHERQAEYAAKVKGMTPEEELEFFRKYLRKNLARNGWTLVRVKPGIMRLKRIRRGPKRKEKGVRKKAVSKTRK